jgi:hypothetical protein
MIRKKGKKRQMFLNKYMRPLCICKKRPAAINYYKDGKVYYRKKCDICRRKKVLGAGYHLWEIKGYKKKHFCEKCGFKSDHTEQFDVFHVDGNLTNCNPKNLKTICANCQRVLQKAGSKWRQGNLLPDL